MRTTTEVEKTITAQTPVSTKSGVKYLPPADDREIALTANGIAASDAPNEAAITGIIQPSMNSSGFVV